MGKDAPIQAAGGILWRDTPTGRQVALVHRPKYGDWALPKGKLKPVEGWLEAARREVEEETGCQVRTGRYAGQVEYVVEGRRKIVRFWEMSLNGECHFQPGEETDALQWLPVDEALERLSYAGERKILQGWQAA
jgi:8-oxo-dGTP diphosphatase